MVEVMRLSLSSPLPGQIATSAGALRFARPRSAPSGTTLNVVLPVLLVDTASGVSDVTVAVLVTLPLLLVPLDGTIACTVKLTIAPTARLPAKVQPRTVSPLVVAQVQPAGWLPPVTVNPVGSVSVQRGLVAALGPRLRTWMLNVTGSPATAGAGLALLLIIRSAPGVTGVDTSSVLLPTFGSGIAPALTTAALVMLPLPTLTLARKLKDALSPLATAPAWVAVIVPALKVQPGPMKLPATSVTPAGNVSTTLKPDDAFGPSLNTCRVYVTSPPPITGDGVAVFCRRRSPDCCSVVPWLSWLLSVSLSLPKNGCDGGSVLSASPAAGSTPAKPTALWICTVPAAIPAVFIWISNATEDDACVSVGMSQRIRTGEPPRLAQNAGNVPGVAPAGRSNRATASETVSISPFSTTTW